jgi:release factor glutamine methyltransferase
VSNPPYIAHDELQTLAVVKHEPSLALDGGADGLDLVRRLLAGARDLCRPGAWVFVEHGADQGAAVLVLAHEHLRPSHAEIVQDYAGLDRFLRAQL